MGGPSLHDELGQAYRAIGAGPVGVAVSGGGDSMALLYALRDVATAANIRAVTVDHGLRDGSNAEATWVGQRCAEIGVAHDVLTWKNWDGLGNLQDQARRARYGLIRDWAQMHNLNHVALAHTGDDQAETFLMRLARQAGLDGLATMPHMRQDDGVIWWRPFLGVKRDALRTYLRAIPAEWIDDPSNDDVQFERVRIRNALPELAKIGLDVDTLCAVARQMGDAKHALEHVLHDHARRIAHIDGRDIWLHRADFLTLSPEFQRRLINAALIWVSQSEYPPRRNATAAVLEAIDAEIDFTLHGCHVVCKNDKVIICREFNTVRKEIKALGEVWDVHWIVEGVEETPKFTVRALGDEGLKQCPEWRKTDRPRVTLLASPSIWDGSCLIAAPLAGMPENYSLRQAPNIKDFYTSLISR